jgi:cyclic pyranopterin phosphate synthase
MSKLSHFDKDGKAAMVDISDKSETKRTAIAKGSISMEPETLSLIEAGTAKKGDVLGIARVAGIMAAKKASDLIPLCHPLALNKVTVDFTLDKESSRVDIKALAKVDGKTGVEMEALTAVSVAALTIYDMVKAVDKNMVIGDIRLAFKDGGKSGTYKEPQGEKEDKRSEPKARATVRPQEVPLTPTRLTTANGSREALRAFMQAKRIKPMRWAQDAGIAPGTLYGFLQGRIASLSDDDVRKLADAVHADTHDLFPGSA